MRVAFTAVASFAGKERQNRTRSTSLLATLCRRGRWVGMAFNFIFRACRECNACKAHAERHVSSVTLFNSPGRQDDERAQEAALRKGRGLGWR